MMLYAININQKAAIDSGLPLRFQHLAIIAVLKNMFSAPDTHEVWHDGRSYKWVAIQLIVDELPILDLEKRRVSALLSELVEMQIIMRHPENQSMRKSFFRAGSKWSDLFSSMQKNAEYYAKKDIATMQKNADDHSNNDHYTIKQNKRDFSENLQPIPAVIEAREALNKTPDCLPHYDSEKSKQAWATWVAYLIEKGKRPARATLEAHAKNLRQYGEATANAMIAQAIEKGWASLYPLAETAEKPNEKRMPILQKPKQPLR